MGTNIKITSKSERQKSGFTLRKLTTASKHEKKWTIFVVSKKEEPFVLSLPFWYVTQAQNTSLEKERVVEKRK
jgi:hypothetical protein